MQENTQPGLPVEHAPLSFVCPKVWREVEYHLGLSNREAQVARCIVNGCSQSDMANCLGISIHTVHTHLERLYRKLGVSSKCQVVVQLFATYFVLSGYSGAEGA